MFLKSKNFVQTPEIKRYFINDSAVCWELGTDIDRSINRRVINLYSSLKKNPLTGGREILDVVPSYKSIAIYFDPYTPNLDSQIEAADKIIKSLLADEVEEPEITPAAIVVIPVVYDGPDIERVASLNGLRPEEVPKIHTSSDYTVAMIAFRPYFPYLIGLDPRLHTPRLESPRKKVPAGSVGIGGEQTGVYPEISPGGWNLIGRTDPVILRTLEPGTTIKFKKVKKL